MTKEELDLEMRQLQIEHRAICRYADVVNVEQNEHYEKLKTLLPPEELQNLAEARLEALKAFSVFHSAIKAGIQMRIDRLQAELIKRHGGEPPV